MYDGNLKRRCTIDFSSGSRYSVLTIYGIVSEGPNEVSSKSLCTSDVYSSRVMGEVHYVSAFLTAVR